MRKSLAYKLVVILLSSSLLWFFAQFVSAAWQDATEDFPGGVPAAPLDTSSLNQDKTGGVTFGTSNKTKIEDGRILFNAAGSPTGQIYWYGGKLMAREGTSAWQLAVDKMSGCGTATTGKIWWDSTNSKFVCGTDGGGSGSGVTSINGQAGPGITIAAGSPNVAISAFDNKVLISVSDSGTGGITAVLTGSGSGLVGGADSGDVNLSLDKSALTDCGDAISGKVYWNGNKFVCGQDGGGGTGNIIDTLSATLTAGNDAGGQNAVNFGRISIGVVSLDTNYRITTAGGGIKAVGISGQPAGYFQSPGTGPSLFVDGTIKITGGSPGTGKVLTSDAVGAASWQPASGGGQWQTQSGTSNIFYNTGKVGVGTNDPQALFDIKGDLHIGGEYNQPSYSLVLGIGAIDEYGPISGHQSSPGNDTTPADDTINPFNNMCANYTGTYTDWFKTFDANGNFVDYASQPVICRTDSNIYKVRNSYGTVEFLNSAGDVKASLDQNGVLTVASCVGCGGGPSTNFWTQTGSVLYPNQTSWNVGIGTTSPGEKLTVYGADLTRLRLQSSQTGGAINDIGLVFGNSQGTGGTWTQHSAIYLKNSNMKYEAYYDHDFQTNNGSGLSSKLIIKGNGNVGIGTTNPTAKLTIGGTAGVDGIKFPDGTLQTTAGGGGGGGWTDDGTIVRLDNPSDEVALGRDGFTNLVRLTGFKGSSNETRFDINPMTINSSVPSTVTLFRNTNTTGERSLIMFAGNGTADRVNKFSVKGDSWINGGAFGIGTRTPAALLHVAGEAKIDTNLYIGDKLALNSADKSISFKQTAQVSQGKKPLEANWRIPWDAFGNWDFQSPQLDTCGNGDTAAFICTGLNTASCYDRALVVIGGIDNGTATRQLSCVAESGNYTIRNSSNNLVFVNGSNLNMMTLGQDGVLGLSNGIKINNVQAYILTGGGSIEAGAGCVSWGSAHCTSSSFSCPTGSSIRRTSQFYFICTYP